MGISAGFQPHGTTSRTMYAPIETNTDQKHPCMQSSFLPSTTRESPRLAAGTRCSHRPRRFEIHQIIQLFLDLLLGQASIICNVSLSVRTACFFDTTIILWRRRLSCLYSVGRCCFASLCFDIVARQILERRRDWGTNWAGLEPAA